MKEDFSYLFLVNFMPSLDCLINSIILLTAVTASIKRSLNCRLLLPAVAVTTFSHHLKEEKRFFCDLSLILCALFSFGKLLLKMKNWKDSMSLFI